MRTIAMVAAALACAVAGDARAADGRDGPRLGRVMAESRQACRADVVTPAFLVEGLAGIGGLDSCPHRPDLAFRLAAAMASSRAEASAGHALLAQLYRRGLGISRNEAAAAEHQRRAWLLVAPGMMERPFTDPAEAGAWLARPETIAFLRRHGRGGAAEVRARLAQALLARLGDGDEAEAARILADPAVELSSVARLVRARRDLTASDEAVRAAALREIRTAARSDYDGGEASDLVAGLARRRLAAAASAEERHDAIALLADAAFARGSAHRATFFAAVEAANGSSAPANLASERTAALREQLRSPLGLIDYPPAALRAGEQGRVALRGLLDPSGRIVFTEPLSQDQPARLVAGTRRHYALRRLPPLDPGMPRPTRYVWIDLPVVTFRLPAD